MSMFIASWLAGAADLLEGEFSRPVDLLPGAAIAEGAAAFTLMVDIAGEWGGTFTVTADESALGVLFAELKKAEVDAEAKPEELAAGDGGEPLTPEAVREEWQRLFRRICIDAAAEVSLKSGRSCEVAMISPELTAVGSQGMGYQLRAGEPMVALLIADLVEAAAPEPPRPEGIAEAAFRPPPPASGVGRSAYEGRADGEPSLADVLPSKGIELLLDVELEASLRFGSREMALSELLSLGPGDVIQLDRALADPVDLIIGDRIVARGEVVLVNGNFGLQVTEVAQPRKSLETIRCLF